MIRTLKLISYAVMFCLPLCHGVAGAAQYQAFVIPTASNEILASASSISNTGIVFGSYGGSCVTGNFLWSKEYDLINLTVDIEYSGAPNASGQIVGTQRLEDNIYTAIVRDASGSIRQLNYMNPLDSGSAALAVSDDGLAIGSSGNQPVIWDIATETVTQIGEALPGELGGSLGSAAINSTGYAAWTYCTNRRYSDGHTGVELRSFRKSPCGVVTECIPAEDGSIYGFVKDVAYDGTVLFSSTPTGNSYLWNPDETLTQLGLDRVTAMSQSGLILGTLGTRQIVLGVDGILSDLPMPDGATYMAITDINNSGEVVGWATYSDGNRAVLWQPVPEPSSVFGLLCGLGSLTGFALKKRK